METVAELGRQALAGERLGRPQLLALVESSDGQPEELLHWAWRVRSDRFGRAVRLCCIAPGKLGGCAEDCKWCAQSARRPGHVEPKRTAAAEIQAMAGRAIACGASHFGIVNSGRRPAQRDLDEVAAACRGIVTQNGSRIRMCASLGEINEDQASLLASAGITRYHHNLETSRRFFPQVVSTHGYEERIATLKSARRAGLSTCCGGLLGMGETWQDRVDLALTIRDEVAPDVVPLNFLNPIAGTALQDVKPIAAMDALRTIAVFRLAMPDVDIKVAGGREVNLRDLQGWVFYAGATSMMTGNYLTTAGRGAEADLKMIADLGLEVVTELPPKP